MTSNCFAMAKSISSSGIDITKSFRINHIRKPMMALTPKLTGTIARGKVRKNALNADNAIKLAVIASQRTHWFAMTSFLTE